jgi:hypothetical protein
MNDRAEPSTHSDAPRVTTAPTASPAPTPELMAGPAIESVFMSRRVAEDGGDDTPSIRSLPPGHQHRAILGLQRSVGNAAVQRFLHPDERDHTFGSVKRASASSMTISEEECVECGAKRSAAAPPSARPGLRRSSALDPVHKGRAGRGVERGGPQQAAPAAMVQRRHLTIDESVAAFTSQIDIAGTPSTVTSGQFYWSTQLASALKAAITKVMSVSTLGSSELHMVWANLTDVIEAIFQYKDTVGPLATVNKILKTHSDATDATKIRSLLRASTKAGEQMYNDFWAFHDTKRAVPDFSPYLSIPTLMALHAYEQGACGETAGRITGSFHGKGGFKGADPDRKRDDPRFKGGKFSMAVCAGKTPLDLTPVPPNGFVKGEAIVYTGLASAVALTKAALDNGFTVTARVLSGWGSNNPSPCHTEHSIVIIGYDGDEFVFWDPASGASSARGSGFGSLFFDGTRLTTARDPAKFLVSNPDGIQSDNQHRYQVVGLFVK